jgi:hypothetical protein
LENGLLSLYKKLFTHKTFLQDAINIQHNKTAQVGHDLFTYIVQFQVNYLNCFRKKVLLKKTEMAS